MQKKIVYVLILMSVCTVGISVLQLYWNYQNYRAVVATFKKDADEALDVAVNNEINLRRKGIVSVFKTWMADTSIMKITCDTANREHQTAFTMTDTHPYFPGEKADQRTMGISAFKQKLGKITPEAKALFINHFAKIVEDDLRDGTTYYYTQGIGHRLDKIFNDSRLNLEKLKNLFAKELLKRKIDPVFKLSVRNTDKTTDFVTHKANAAFRRPYKNEPVWATLETPNKYYFREMKWLIISSGLLIFITLFCFYYTINTLLNQYKLVAIKNQFISNMTHEINTPLSSIQITAEALQQFDHDKETQQNYLGIILHQTRKLNELAKEILEDAKLENLDLPRDEQVNLGELLSTIVTDVKLEKNINWKYTTPKEKINIKGNKLHLGRSISNIIENAVKYNMSPEPTIEIDLVKSQNEIKLTIKDNGLGIANEYKEKIFDQFYRIPTGNIHNIKGFGLGLSYVKKVIAQHQGNISVEDNYPSGTIFSINLPS